MIERQTFVTWYTPEEKKPPEGEIVIVTVSGHVATGTTIAVKYDHAFAKATWFDDGYGWELEDVELEEGYIIHAWCDLEPYGVKEEKWGRS